MMPFRVAKPSYKLKYLLVNMILITERNRVIFELS